MPLGRLVARFAVAGHIYEGHLLMLNQTRKPEKVLEGIGSGSMLHHRSTQNKSTITLSQYRFLSYWIYPNYYKNML